MKTLDQRVREIENGRFEKIANAVNFKEVCEKCDSMNPDIKDNRQAYRCFCIGSCPPATLSPRLMNYIWIRSRP